MDLEERTAVAAVKSVRALAIIGDVFFDPLARSEVVPGLVTEAPVVPGSRTRSVS